MPFYLLAGLLLSGGERSERGKGQKKGRGREREGHRYPLRKFLYPPLLVPYDRALTEAEAAAAEDRRLRRSSLRFDVHDIHHVQQHSNQCSHRRLDTCAWPQCNLACPVVRHPLTGDQLDFVDLLMQFGLDLAAIADALGVDLATLHSMDHAELLALLTKHAR